VIPSSNLATPETYLNPDRSQGFAQPLQRGVHAYGGVPYVHPNEFALGGTWSINSQSATPVSSGATIQAGFEAANVYLVMTAAGNVPRSVRVLLDGKPIGPAQAGADVHGATVTVQGQRLYSLVSLPADQFHMLTVDVPPGVSAYDFTFG
jgi:hypothetical protein